MNLKFDVQKLTDQFNKATDFLQMCGIAAVDNITTEQMSEMIQIKAFELGYFWNDGDKKVYGNYNKYLFIYSDNKKSMTTNFDSDINYFNEHENKEADLSFFSLQPEKVTIEINRADLDKIQNGFDIKVVK